MKPIKFFGLLLLPCIFILLALQTSGAAEFKQKLFITDIEYPFFSNPFFQQQFSHVSPGRLQENAMDVQKQAVAVILDYGIAMKVSQQAKAQMRNMLVGDEPRKIVFVMGYGVDPNFIQKYLELKTASFAEIFQDSQNKIFATGLYNTTTKKGGPFVQVNMLSAEEIPEERQLQDVSEMIDKMLKMQAEQRSQAAPPFWKPMGVQWEYYDSVFCGKYNQSVEIKKLENDNSRFNDYWTSKITNESVSGITAHNNGYKNHLNDTRMDMDDPKQKIISYGPGGDVSEGSTASVSIGTSGPSVSWSWPTGKTSLKNLSDMSKGFCQWQVNYASAGQEAESTYTWYPGIETQTQQDKQFRLKIENEMVWDKLLDKKLFRNRWKIYVDLNSFT